MKNNICHTIWLIAIILFAFGCRNLSEQLPNKQVDTEADLKVLTKQGIKFNPDRVVIPGKRVGLIVAQTSRQVLPDILSAEQLRDTTYLDEHGVSSSATVYYIDNRNQMVVFWVNDKQQNVQKVLIKGERNDYITPEGVFVGATTAEVVQANQNKPFHFKGFVRNDWGNGGQINDFGNGVLEAYNGKWQVQMQYDGREELAELSLDKFPPDVLHSSNSPDVQLLTMTVAQMWVYLNK